SGRTIIYFINLLLKCIINFAWVLIFVWGNVYEGEANCLQQRFAIASLNNLAGAIPTERFAIALFPSRIW
ncbi:hypothetical protein MEO43_28405, partial [Dolichospermum sp. ST_sed5]|nr:hypothetical protein [Dolichospermum sp. ST_sed5]